MFPIVLLVLAVLASPPPDPWQEIRLSIVRDPYVSSDHASLCRVRAVNLGGRRWSGRALRFEARAYGSGGVAVERGRFGLELEPYGSLETVIGFTGRYDRFEVSPVSPSDPAGPSKKSRRRASRRGRRPRR
jgi:hypothetical protein